MTISARARRLPEVLSFVATRPRVALGVIVAAQAAAVLVFARTGPAHNGWVYYQGGDQLWHTTGAALLAGFDLPPAYVGYVWSLLIAPIVGIAAPGYLSALPGIVLLNTLILAPVATLAVYGIGRLLGGSYAGLWLASLWVIAPYASIPLFKSEYHDRWVDQFLPQAVGLTAMPDYPSMVALVVAGYFVLRSLASGSLHEAVVAGVLAGLAGGIKPANFLFLAGPALAYVLARGWRAGAVFGLALIPALFTLAIWKQRGLGNLPLFATGERQLAASIAQALPVGGLNLDRYLDLDWETFRQSMSGLREFFFSARLAQWACVAGVFALGRRSLPAAGLFGGWLAAFILVKGTSPLATVESGSFFRLLLPAWPAYLTLAAAVPLLVPGVLGRLRRWAADRQSSRHLSTRTVAALCVVAVGVPFVFAVGAQPLRDGSRAVHLDEILIPTDESVVATSVSGQGEGNLISWTPRNWKGRVFYRVLRGKHPTLNCSTSGAALCSVSMTVIASTHDASYLDRDPPPDAVYRVGVGTNWLDDPDGGDVFLVGSDASAP